MPTISLSRRLLLAAAVAGLAATPALAQDYPTKPLKIVVPFGAGGSADGVARGIAQHLEPFIGVPVVVENRPGAGTITGTLNFLAQPDDGYTLLVSTQPQLSIASFRNQFKMDQIAFLNIQQYEPTQIMVRADSPHKTIQDLVAFAKANPGQISWSGTAIGSSRVVGETFFKQAGVEVRFIPFDSGGDSDLALLGGHVNAKAGGIASDLQGIGDKGRMLAVAADARVPYAPDVPTFDEVFKAQGIDVPKVGAARFLAVRSSFKEKHPDRFAKLAKAYSDMYHSEKFQAFLKSSGAAETAQFMTPEEATKEAKEMHDTLEAYKNIAIGGG
jgi:putative tricarboxylic transport membrane protein